MNERRKELIREVALKRQKDITVILENVHNSHNVGAVMRTCDSVGITEIYLLNSDNPGEMKNFKLGKRTTSGARKWVDVYVFNEIEPCIKAVRSKYKTIIGTHIGSQAKSLYEIDLTGSVALVFGNEAKGLSEELLAELDGNMIIPQVGMVKSLNISVACAVTLYEAYRQREAKGMYANDQNNIDILEDYLERSNSGHIGRRAKTKLPEKPN
jgi:tRNA (guanosine-2'-O-)-methyltransferase